MDFVRLNFVSPLYTGDASKKARRVISTGLLGSLRWWYEAIIRGLGGWACDPTDERLRCPPNGQTVKPETVTRLLCPACQLFGATGWAKRFILTVEDDTREEYPPTGEGRECTDKRKCANREGKPVCWYFPSGRGGEVTLRLLPRHPGDDEVVQILIGLLEFVRRNAALGAKTNLGYGLFEWIEPPKDLPPPEDFARWLAGRAQRGRRHRSGTWPDLREMFFAEVALNKEWSPTDFVHFKCQLRSAFRKDGFSARLRHFLLGKVSKKGNEASKIKMALRPDKRMLRVWGWVPQNLPGGVPRSDVMEILQELVGKGGTLTRWQEFSPERSGPKDYLASLMGA